MLEYFTYQRFKKHQAEKLAAAKAEEVLSPQDEQYLEHLVEDDGPKEIPLENKIEGEGSRSNTPTPSTSSSTKQHTWKTEMVDRAKTISTKLPAMPAMPAIAAMPSMPSMPTLPAFMQHSKKDGKKKAELEPHTASSHGSTATIDDAELTAEERELHEALDKLNLAAQDGKAFSLSGDTKVLLNKFTQILKDMVNGVPTAYDDLVKLFETSSAQIEKLFESTPGFLKKMIKSVPLGPPTEKGSTAEGIDVAAKTAMLSIPTLKELIKKPGAVAATLRSVLNALKLRFPGLAMGSNVLLSMGLFVLLFVFWYCYKRGREVRLEKEAAEAEASAAALAEAPDVPTNEPGSSEPPSAIEAERYAAEPMRAEQSVKAATVPVNLSKGS